MSETFVVMTRCSTGIVHGPFSPGDARRMPSRSIGESVARSHKIGRQGNERTAKV